MSEQSDILNRKVLDGFEIMVTDRRTREILLHAIDVFAKKGLSATKIKDIAEKAGFSQGFVYNYFKSKEELYSRIVGVAAEGAASMVKNAAGLEGTPLQKISWLAEAMLSAESIVMQHWRLIMLQVSTSDAVPEEAKKQYNEKMMIPIGHMIQMIKKGQETGEIIKEDPAMLALTFFSIVQGLGITRVQGGTGIPFPSIDLVLKFLKP